MIPPGTKTESMIKCSPIIIPTHALNLNLHLSKSIDLPCYIRAACVKEVLKYILFSRGIFPVPSDQLLSFLDGHEMGIETDTNVKRGLKMKTMRRHRKYEKHATQLQKLLIDIDYLFDTYKTHVKIFVITFGPTLNSPREQYVIRFYEWDGNFSVASNDYASSSDSCFTPSVDDIERLQKEIGKRSVREMALGMLQEEYAPMFERRSSESSTMKVNLAACISEFALNALVYKPFGKPRSFHDNLLEEHVLLHIDLDTDANASMNGNTSRETSSNTRFGTFPFTVHRHLHIRIPRMYSKTIGPRPFVVFNLVPMMRPSHISKDVESPLMKDMDCTWITFKSYVKGFTI